MKTADKFEDFKEYVLEKEKEGKVVVATIEGFAECPLEDIIKQPTDGLLYDLNRDKAVVLTFIKDKKWVNDYACALVIAKLKQKLTEHDKELTAKIKELKEEETNFHAIEVLDKIIKMIE